MSCLVNTSFRIYKMPPHYSATYCNISDSTVNMQNDTASSMHIDAHAFKYHTRVYTMQRLVYTHTHMNRYNVHIIRMCLWVCIYIYCISTYISIYIYIHIYIYIYMYIHVNIYMYVYIYINICMYTCVHINEYIYI